MISKSQIHNEQVYSMSSFIDRFPFIVTLGVTNARNYSAVLTRQYSFL